MTDHLEMQQYLKANLSKKRFTHVMNVAAESRILAETFGGVAPDTAYFAGMVHDICKEMDESEQFNWMMRSDMGVCLEEQKSPKVWHEIRGDRSGSFACGSIPYGWKSWHVSVGEDCLSGGFDFCGAYLSRCGAHAGSGAS